MNPDKTLEALEDAIKDICKDITNAVKHRTISSTQCWHIVYYHGRICCVPTIFVVPPEIILGKFTDQEAQDGFTVYQWNQFKTQIALLYKELYK
ncbi:hypothetical protein ES708_16145 [subsurface metagenome]